MDDEGELSTRISERPTRDEIGRRKGVGVRKRQQEVSRGARGGHARVFDASTSSMAQR